MKVTWTFMLTLLILMVGFGTLPAFSASTVDTIHDSKFSCESCHKEGVSDEDLGITSCLNCHGSYSDLAEATQGVEYNPHDSHLGELSCSLCHVPHGESVFYCNNCHAEWEQELPENVN